VNADELRRPLSERERAALVESCARSGVPVKIVDPELISRTVALLPAQVGDLGGAA
jgi:hypothetical protein